ncbi:hypothetical protein [Streptomyces sp. enrichment culture]|uniref:hypothetical protein n=1 Tax=Streptomyces sp. enrichment culture TaxID=1795815 RepID=UPI003F57D50C
MSSHDHLVDLPLAGSVIATGFEGWTDDIHRDFEIHAHDGHVGSRLLGETDRVRVWEIRLAPGQRWHAHRHVLDYFWTAVEAGKSLQHTSDGTTRVVEYEPGETRHFQFPAGTFLLHDIQNIGSGWLVFTTVEFLDSANEPLALHAS